MNNIKPVYKAVFLTVCVMISPSLKANHAKNTRYFYSINEACNFKKDGFNTSFVLYLGAFKSRHNADEYGVALQKKINQHVNTKFNSAKSLYNVYVGPLSSARELNAMCNRMQEKRPVLEAKFRPKKAVKPIKNDQSTDSTSSRLLSPSAFIMENHHATDAVTSRSYAPSTFITTMSVGPAWPHGGQAQTFYLQPEVENTYTANQPKSALVDSELFIGFEHAIHSKINAQLGLAAAFTSSADLSGNIWIDTDPDFNNFTYQYSVQHAHVALKGKLLTESMYSSLKPYVGASIGVGFNEAKNYSNTALLEEASVEPNFASNTTTTFTYTFEVGVQLMINRQWQTGIGYQFADWGKSQLGRAPGQTIGNGLKIDHFYTNGLMFNLTHFY